MTLTREPQDRLRQNTRKFILKLSESGFTEFKDFQDSDIKIKNVKRFMYTYL